jgi:uncharacterized membrane protein
MDKKILIIAIILITFLGAVYFIGTRVKSQEPSREEIIQCLADSGVLVYGTLTCPACNKLVEDFGGYELIGPIYVICNEERDRCEQEMLDAWVPEIQIKGELYNGPRTFEALTQAVGCEF